MDIRPILSTLRRHKTASALIVLEIALSCAIICNAVFLISTRLERMDRPSGLVEQELVRLQYAAFGADGSDAAAARIREDLAALRSIRGVRAATFVNQVPYGNSAWHTSVNLEPEQQNPSLEAAVYLGDEQLLETLGLRIVAGRDFTDEEYIDFSALEVPESELLIPAVILAQATAERLFPGEDAVGKVIYSWGSVPTRVVGVVEHLVRPTLEGGPAEVPLSMVLPVRVTQGNYVLRTDPSRRNEVLEAAKAELERVNPTRILLDDDTVEELRGAFYQQDKAMAWLLVAVCVALLVVTALGIVGLASFWVQQRTKQIGVRRALGATRGQVLRYFQMENFLLATVGIAVGMMLAYGINMSLMERYELPRLPAIYLPIGALALWLLGQVSVFGPARRAASVPPAVATRSV